MSGYGKTKIEELYHSFTDGFLGELRSDDFYTYFMNAIKSGQSNVLFYEKFVERNVDIRWVEMIEDTIIPLDNIIRNPQRYIKNEEEIVPIEMVRTVTTESIRHLAQHTNMIAMVKNDEVTPNKMLNIIKEESFETYENRFIYTLLQKLEYFLDKRLQALMSRSDVQDQFELKLNGDCEAGHDKFTYELNVNCVTPHIELSNDQLNVDADTSQLNVMQRIERVRKILYNFRESAFIKSLHGCPLVRPPLNMTNVLTKNQNFRKAVDLWVFIESYDEVGYNVSYVERQASPSDTHLNELFSVIALQYVIMKKNTGRMDELADYSERRKELQPNIIKKEIDDIIDSYDLEIEEIHRIFVDRVERKKKKERAHYAKVKDIIARALALESEKISEIDKKRRIKAEKEAEKLRKEQKRLEEQARREAEEKARIEAEEKARLEAEEKARLEAEEKARLEAEEKARLEAEEKARLEAEEKARLEAEEKARLEAEEKARLEAEEKARLEAEEKARLEAEEKARIEAEDNALREAAAKILFAAEEKARLEAEEKARLEAEESAKIEPEDSAEIDSEEEAMLEAAEKAKTRVNDEIIILDEKSSKKKSRRLSVKDLVNIVKPSQKAKKSKKASSGTQKAAVAARASDKTPNTKKVVAKKKKKVYDGSRKKPRNKRRLQKKVNGNGKK